MAQERIKVNVAVINNGYLGMVRQWQQFFYGKRYVATPFEPRLRQGRRSVRPAGHDGAHGAATWSRPYRPRASTTRR